jgi:PelA/Pel-15E family pectate lyase
MKSLLHLTVAFVMLHAAAAQDAPAPSLKLEVKADYLALRITGVTDLKVPTWQWRVLPRSAADQVAWSPFDGPGPAGTFKLATPMPWGGWYRAEVRALDGDNVLKSAGVTRPEPHPFEMVTPERIATLPENQRAAWTEYLAQSQERAKYERDVIADECRVMRAAISKPAPSSREEFEFPSKVELGFYGSPEASKLADAVLSYQTPTGAWSKAIDYAQGPRPRGTHWTSQSGEGWHYCGTLDNRSTTEQIEFLARVHSATKREDCRRAVERGIAWLIEAQFPNGGWPQVYPLEPGYHEAITLNDDAMTHALETLLAISTRVEPFAFVEDETKKRAAQSFERGIACLLECQVRVNGIRTVWCAQHDPISLSPVAARLKEPPSLSGAESANLLKFLMRSGPITEPVRRAIEDAVAWLDAHRITDLRKTTNVEGKTDYVKDPASPDVLWARFYDVETAHPLFAGAQDGIIYHTFHEMAEHNKVAYDYFTTKPHDILTKEVPRWKKRFEKAAKQK